MQYVWQRLAVKNFLKKLDKDVTIYQVVQSGSEDETIKNLLEKYEEGSDHIKVEQKDPVVPSYTPITEVRQLSVYSNLNDVP